MVSDRARLETFARHIHRPQVHPSRWKTSEPVSGINTAAMAGDVRGHSAQQEPVSAGLSKSDSSFQLATAFFLYCETKDPTGNQYQHKNKYRLEDHQDPSFRTGDKLGRFALTLSPLDLPANRRRTHGARYVRAQSISSRR